MQQLFTLSIYRQVCLLSAQPSGSMLLWLFAATSPLIATLSCCVRFQVAGAACSSQDIWEALSVQLYPDRLERIQQAGLLA